MSQGPADRPAFGLYKQPSSRCPPGLEYLTKIDQLLIKQEVKYLKALTVYQAENKYAIYNTSGQKVSYAVEEFEFCIGNRFGNSSRPFKMNILDNDNNKVILMSRPLPRDMSCFSCCLHRLDVFCPPGTIVGVVQQQWTIFDHSFTIVSPEGETVLKIRGPLCTASSPGHSVNFEVLSADGQIQVGRISKNWSGTVREIFTDADFFGITFPANMDFRLKAVLLGACFLIDMIFYED